MPQPQSHPAPEPTQGDAARSFAAPGIRRHNRRAELIAFLTACVVTAPLTGCSVLVDSEGLTGAGTGQQDASVGQDAALDSGALDGGTETGEDSQPGEAGAGFCASKTHDFCDDFDSQPLTQKWTEVRSEAGSVTTPAGISVSPPNALKVQPAAAAPDYSSAAPFLMLTAPSTSYHVEASILVAQKGSAAAVELLTLSFNPPSGFAAYQVSFGFRDGYYRMMEWAQQTAVGDHTDHADLATTTSFAAWRRVGIDVKLSGSGSSAVLTLDGQQAGELQLEPAPALGVTIGVGAPSVEGVTADWTILVDNVVIDAS